MKCTNEIRVLREFVREFNPFYAGVCEEMDYEELVSVVKLTVEEM